MCAISTLIIVYYRLGIDKGEYHKNVEYITQKMASVSTSEISIALGDSFYPAQTFPCYENYRKAIQYSF